MGLAYVILVHHDYPYVLGSFADLDKAKCVATQEAKKAHELYGKRLFVWAEPVRCIWQLKNELGESFKVIEIFHDTTALDLGKDNPIGYE